MHLISGPRRIIFVAVAAAAVVSGCLGAGTPALDPEPQLPAATSLVGTDCTMVRMAAGVAADVAESWLMPDDTPSPHPLPDHVWAVVIATDCRMMASGERILRDHGALFAGIALLAGTAADDPPPIRVVAGLAAGDDRSAEAMLTAIAAPGNVSVSIAARAEVAATMRVAAEAATWTWILEAPIPLAPNEPVHGAASLFGRDDQGTALRWTGTAGPWPAVPATRSQTEGMAVAVDLINAFVAPTIDAVLDASVTFHPAISLPSEEAVNP